MGDVSKNRWFVTWSSQSKARTAASSRTVTGHWAAPEGVRVQGPPKRIAGVQHQDGVPMVPPPLRAAGVDERLWQLFMFDEMNKVLASARLGAGFHKPLQKWEDGFNYSLKKYGVHCKTTTYSGNPKNANSSWVTFKFQPLSMVKGAR